MSKPTVASVNERVNELETTLANKDTEIADLRSRLEAQQTYLTQVHSFLQNLPQGTQKQQAQGPKTGPTQAQITMANQIAKDLRAMGINDHADTLVNWINSNEAANRPRSGANSIYSALQSWRSKTDEYKQRFAASQQPQQPEVPQFSAQPPQAPQAPQPESSLPPVPEFPPETADVEPPADQDSDVPFMT